MSTSNHEMSGAGAGTDPTEFVFSRAVDAPRDLVFRAWTEPDRLRNWWGPKGFTVTCCEVDLRPGGVFHYGLESSGGNVMWGKWVFREIAAPERLVFVSSFSDEQSGTAPAPFPGDWPVEILSSVTFEEQDGRTVITLRATPHNAIEAEREFFRTMHDSMKAGWTGTFGQLEGYLASA